MMSRGRGFDVIVLGSGFAGRSVALHGARLGMKVLVLESPTETPPVVWLPPAREQIGQPAGLLFSAITGPVNHQPPVDVEHLRIAETGEQWKKLRRATERGSDLREIGSEDLRDLLPALRVDCPGALSSRRLDFMEPGRLFVDLRREAEMAGATIVEDLPALRIARESVEWRIETTIGTYHAPRLINAAGMRAAAIAADLGQPVPAHIRGSTYMATDVTAPLTGSIVSFPESGLSLRQPANGSIVLRWDRTPDGGDAAAQFNPHVLAASARAACRALPVLSDLAMVRTWFRRESRLPDDRPAVGQSAGDNRLFHLFGLDDPGAEIGAGVVLAGWLATGAPTIGMDDMRIERFAG